MSTISRGVEATGPAKHREISIVAGSAVAVFTAIAIVAAQTTGPNLPPLVPASMRGADLFRLYCATCHGQDGRGHGPVAAALRTPPSDLTMLSARNQGPFPRTRVEATLTGRDAAPAHGSEEMPVWGPIFKGLDPSDARVKVRISNLISHIESIQQK